MVDSVFLDLLRALPAKLVDGYGYVVTVDDIYTAVERKCGECNFDSIKAAIIRLDKAGALSAVFVEDIFFGVKA